MRKYRIDNAWYRVQRTDELEGLGLMVVIEMEPERYSTIFIPNATVVQEGDYYEIKAIK